MAATGTIGALPASIVELCESPRIRAALEWFHRERRWINDVHLRLCRIPAPTFFEQKRAEWMIEQFRAIGWQARLDRAGNVLASRHAWRPEKPFVALTAHLDTVLAPHADEEVRVNGDGRLLGPGTSDNGAGLAALLAIANVWVQHPPLDAAPLDLLLVANVGEEGEGNLSGMRYLCRAAANSPRIRSFLVLDGPNLDHITCQALASRRFDLQCTGPGGHSWSDYGIANPVHALSRAITLFADQAPNGTGPRSSYNFGLLEGGSSINSIPSSARAKVDLRSESADRLDQMAALLGQSLDRAVDAENLRATGAKITARIREIGSRPGGRLAGDAPILRILRAVDDQLGINSRFDCASTDANIPLSLGLPAVSIGAGGQGGGAHTAAEWFHPEGRDLGLRRILMALCLLLQDRSTPSPD